MFERKPNNTPPKPRDYKRLADPQLMELCAAKDEDAFSEIVGRYERFVYSTVFAELKNTDDAFDVSQEVFIRLYNAAGGFRCESTLKTWLYRMCKNCAYDYMRKYYKHRAVSLTYKDAEEETTEDADIVSDTTPEDELLRKEKIQAVRNAVLELPEEQREVIVLREFQNMQYSEIAVMLGISEGTVKSRISRAREHLKKILENFRL
ncbi:MAG: sigma-70 family RNA polymerase sigma factor [Ruminococcaceae bacterium]|nr:sigma-70 family RNA polymerase sigma factor [Oscillospiraceae bacterium]